MKTYLSQAKKVKNSSFVRKELFSDDSNYVLLPLKEGFA